MEICELQKGKGNVDVEGIIISIGEVKSFEKYGKKFRVASAELEDISGKVLLTLWNDDIDKFKIGDHVKITNGYINEFQSKLQLTAGRAGKIEKIEEKQEEKQEEKPKEIQEEKKVEPKEPIKPEVEKPIQPEEKKKRGRPKKIPTDCI